MKITKSKLEQIIAEEVKAFVNEGGGQFAKMMSQHARGDAYRAAMRKSDDKDKETSVRSKEREFQKAHKAQLASREGLPDWMMEEEQSNDQLSDQIQQAILDKVKAVATELYQGKIDGNGAAKQLDDMIKGLVPDLKEMGKP